MGIRSILSKKGCKAIKEALKYVEKMKELTSLQTEKFKNNLIKVKNDLIEKVKKINRTKKADREYYEYEENKFYGLKDIIYLFDRNEDDDDIYEGIEYFFNENGLDKSPFKSIISDIRSILPRK